MGILDGLFGGAGAMADPVRGVAQVIAANGYHGRGVYQSCSLQLVVSGDGVPAASIEHHTLIHRDRWPSPAASLPITGAGADPRRLRIEWNQVVTTHDRAAEQAEAVAAAMRPGAAAP